MALSVLTTAALASAISCSSVLQDVSEKPSGGAQLVKLPEWQVSFCNSVLGEFDDVEFEVITTQQSYNLAVSKDELGTIVIEPIRAGRSQLTWQSSQSDATKKIWLEITARRNVWVATKALYPGSDIHVDDVRHAVANVAPLLGVKKLITGNPVGKATLKQVREGDILTTDAVAAPPLVKRNENIQVTVGSGNLQISSPGTALDTGWNIGDQIWVLVENAEGPTEAKVIGKGNVFVEI